ncbi:VOC family protein, partial [Microbacterium gubbeenense]
AVPLTVLTAVGPMAVLGRDTEPVVILEHAPELRHASPRDAGLYHTAIVFETEPALAAAVASVARHAPGTFTGSADHLVSKAFYFTDPEGNGVELYWDRDRTTWSWTHGQVEMGVVRLDPNAYLREHLTEAGAADPVVGGARVGHVHLSIGDVDTARTFYVDQLGFETTLDWNGALFVSAGGYHHHMAMNVWNSSGAGRRGRTLGLGAVNIALPTREDIGTTTERLLHYGVEIRDDGATVSFEDPWANLVRLTTNS